MDPAHLLALAIGPVLVLLGLADVFLTIFHADRPGLVSRWVNVALWRAVRPLAHRPTHARREVLALAGPLMMAATILLWAGLLIGGFALLAWPGLGTSHRVDPALAPPSLLDALYYSGVTFTTLGFGDVTPLTPAAKLLSVVEAGSGFATMTAAIAYLLTLFHGLEARNAMVLRVLAETGGTGRGARFLARVLRDEGPEGARERLEDWADRLRTMQETVHRFPILDFYYRTRSPDLDPEPMLAAVSEAALRARVLAHAPGMRAMRPAAEHLDDALVRFMRAILSHHARRGVREAFERPEPGEAERRDVEEARREMERELGLAPVELPAEEARRVEALALRSRLFLDELDRLTRWRRLRGAA